MRDNKITDIAPIGTEINEVFGPLVAKDTEYMSYLTEMVSKDSETIDRSIHALKAEFDSSHAFVATNDKGDTRYILGRPKRTNGTLFTQVNADTLAQLNGGLMVVLNEKPGICLTSLGSIVLIHRGCGTWEIILKYIKEYQVMNLDKLLNFAINEIKSRNLLNEQHRPKGTEFLF